MQPNRSQFRRLYCRLLRSLPICRASQRPSPLVNISAGSPCAPQAPFAACVFFERILCRTTEPNMMPIRRRTVIVVPQQDLR